MFTRFLKPSLFQAERQFFVARDAVSAYPISQSLSLSSLQPPAVASTKRRGRRALPGLPIFRQVVGADDDDRGRDLSHHPLPRREQTQPQPGPIRQYQPLDGGDAQPAYRLMAARLAGDAAAFSTFSCTGAGVRPQATKKMDRSKSQGIIRLNIRVPP